MSGKEDGILKRSDFDERYSKAVMDNTERKDFYDITMSIRNSIGSKGTVIEKQVYIHNCMKDEIERIFHDLSSKISRISSK